MRTARQIAAAVDLTLGWDIGWQRTEIERLLDADHSTLAAIWSERLRTLGWDVRAEVSFNHYGDRGRIDLLAFHARSGVLLVIEIKTAIVDVQDLLGRLDVKVRIAPIAARSLGWRARRVVPMLVIADTTTARRHVARLAPLFIRFTIRGRAALRWLAEPADAEHVPGVLAFTKLPHHAHSGARRAGRRRVRVPARSPGSARAPGGDSGRASRA